MRRLLYIIMCLTCSMLARAQSYTYRYWFDDDFANAKTTTGASVLKADFDLTGLSESIHALHLQVVDENGVTSSPQTQYFIKTFVSGKSILRYWFDDDYKSAKTVPAAKLVHVDMDVLGLSETIHRLSVQVVDGNGVASLPTTKYFIKTSVSAESKLKYWFDDNIETGGEIKGNNVITNIDVSKLTDGLHKLRTMVVGNAPSAVHYTYFLKTPQVLGVNSMRCVSYIDGKLYKQEDVPADGSLLHYDLDASDVSTGLHLLTVQIVTNTGAASSTSSSWFLRTNTMEELSSMKCFYSIDGEKGMTQAGKFADGTFHFDLDVASVSNGLHRIGYLLVTEDGQTTAMRTAFFIKTPLGGNGISAYHYWLNSDYEGRKQVNMEKNVNPLNLMSLLPVESVPLRSSQFHFEWTNGKPMIYAQNDFHIRFYDAADRCVDQCKDFTDYSVSREITDAELLVSGSSVIKNKPAKNEIQWYHFPALIGDSLAFKVDRACTVQVFAPSGKEVYNASGSEVANWNGCHAWEEGEYYLALHDVTAQQGTSTKLEFFQLGKYEVLSHTPEEVGAAQGYFHVSLFGNGYDKLKKAVLRMGDAHITADTCVVSDISNALLEFYMPTEEQPLGDYDLELYFDNEGKNEKFVVPSAIRVASPVYGDIEIAISSQRRVAKPYPVTIKVTNTGNMAYQMIPFVIGMDHPEKLDEIYTLNFNMNVSQSSLNAGLEVFNETDNLLGKGIKGIVLPTIIPQLHAGETIELQIGFVTEPHAKFNLYAWHYTPWSALSEKAANTVPAWSKAPHNPTCDLNPCDYAIGAECICGIAWGNVSAFANIDAALINRHRKQTLDAYKDDYFAQEILRESGMFDPIPLRNPNDIIRNALAGCVGDITGHDGIGAMAQQLAKMLDNGCPNPEPHPVNPYMPGDPNDMLGYVVPESESKYIAEDVTDVYYNIEFENDSTLANAAAHHIVICDTLNSKLHDLSSFAPTSIKFGDYQMLLDGKEQSFVKTLDMRPAVNALAQIKLDYDATKGIAKWEIQSLDPMTLEPTDDAMMGILPVNDASGSGQGEVTFDIKLRSGLADGTEIPNRASIVFDKEEAIMTPTWVNTIDAVAPTSKILDVSHVNDSTAIVDVEGFDERSGIWHYNLYVQQGEGSAWVLAAENVDTTAIRVKVYDGISYGFCVLATDSAGNVEKKELHREYSIGTYLLGDANSDGVVDLQDAVLIVQYFVEAPDTYLNFNAADCNQDGVIDLQDAVAVVTKYVSSDTRNKQPRKRLNKEILEQ